MVSLSLLLFLLLPQERERTVDAHPGAFDDRQLRPVARFQPASKLPAAL
jgi:hypothetical protein